VTAFALAPEGQGVLDAAWIAARIPHHGAMCLLDGVCSSSVLEIQCRASSHRDAHNPLRAGGRLGPAVAIEYAAQALAVHGALLAGRDDAPKAGFLTSVRDVVFHQDRLDVAADLEIRALLQSGDTQLRIYEFWVSAGETMLVSGRVSVMTDVNPGW
jgi:predicted hotdog family 3-hydroxylacyl-ACP dehydratase